MNWEPLYHDFLTQQWNMHFPAVKQFKQQLYYAEHGNQRFQAPPTGNLPSQQQYGGGNQRPQQFAPINYGAYGGGGGQGSGGYGGGKKKKGGFLSNLLGGKF
jgi:hypothetical protein